MRSRRLLLLVALLIAVVAPVVPAAAHTQIQRATPGPGETIEGPVGFVLLEFLDPVIPTPVIDVTGPDGRPVAASERARMIAEDVARIDFDPVTEAGVYQVDYTFVALDGATQQGAHQFTVAPSGPELGTGRLLAWLVIAALVAVLVLAVVRRRGAKS